MADPLGPDHELRKYFSSEIPVGYPSFKLHHLFGQMECTFKEQIQGKTKKRYWIPIINKNDQRELMDENFGRCRYTSTNGMLTDFLDIPDGEFLQYSVRRALLDVWLGTLAAFLNFHENYDKKYYIPVTGVRFISNASGLADQSAHYDFNNTRANSEGYFAIVTGKYEVDLYVSKYSRHFVHCSNNEKDILCKALPMEKITVPKFSVFFGH